MNSSNFTKTIFECMRLKSLCFWPLRKSFCSEVHRKLYSDDHARFSKQKYALLPQTDSWPQRVFSGIQPTGAIHLGNYFGAVARWRELQDGGANTMCCIADLHSITLPQEPLQLKKNIYQMTATLLACGIDPEKTILFQQSQVPQHAELCWVLACHSTMARLAHLPQFREKSASLKEVPVGIYVYPVLQAADILLYRSTHVPVGEDQVQHLQLAQQLVKTFNNCYGPTFPSPKAIVGDHTVSRLRSLRDPQKKMSKSDADPRSRIELMDSPADIREKCKKAVTDFTSAVTFNPVSRPGVSNLITIHSLLSGLSPEDICRESSGLDTGRYKLFVAEVIARNLAPIREKVSHLMSKHQYLDDVLESGSEKAVRIAGETWNDVKNKACNKHFYPTIRQLLSVLATLPVSTAEVERSFSSMKRIKTYLRNTMCNERLTGLVFMSIHYPLSFTSDDILNVMARKPNRRMVL